jgi:hypothetical protein
MTADPTPIGDVAGLRGDALEVSVVGESGYRSSSVAAPAQGVSTRTRPRSSWTVILVIVALLAATLAAAEAPAVADSDCPEVLPVSAISPGDTGYGLTVSRGTEPEPFDVEVVDVLHNAIAPGFPLIVVETASPEIDRVGGIWSGMSGSPVYIDGKLIGAIAYGFSWSPSKLAGVTPAEAMLQVPGRPTLPPPIAAAEVDLPPELRAQALEDGVAAAQAGTMKQLEIPVRVSGPTGAKFDQFAAEFEKQHPGTRVVRGAAGGGVAGTQAGAETIVPGGNLAVSLWYGDSSAIGVGTATTVCDGVVTAFGHPMMFDGATRMGMHGASAVRVADDAVFGPYKLANAGPLVGTIDQDRLAAVAGRLGSLPVATAITSEITNLDDGPAVVGRTDSIWPDELFAPVLLHGWNNYDALVFDDLYFSGTSQVRWTIDGVHTDGSPWSVTRENRHASRWDLSSASLFEAALYAQLLHDNPFEEVRVSSIDYEAEAGAPYRALEIVGRQIRIEGPDGEWLDPAMGVLVVPGSTLKLQVPLREYRAGLRTIEVELEIPQDAMGGGELIVSSGQHDGDVFECLWDPQECAGGPTESFDQLLETISDQPRADDLTVSLRLYGGFFEDEMSAHNGDDGEPEPVASTTVRLDEVVTGESAFEVYVADTEGCPVPPDHRFVDVWPERVHARSIGCAAALGVTLGVSDDPPRFAPTLPVRRDQAATFIARVLRLGPTELPAPAPSGFTDLAGNVHASAIEQLTAAGIMRGRTPTTFAPAEKVTRAQMASMLVGAVEWAQGAPLEATGGPYFRDVAGVHAANIDVAAEIGLVQGYPDGSFRPSASTPRDQMATLMMRFYRSVVVG